MVRRFAFFAVLVVFGGGLVACQDAWNGDCAPTDPGCFPIVGALAYSQATLVMGGTTATGCEILRLRPGQASETVYRSPDLSCLIFRRGTHFAGRYVAVGTNFGGASNSQCTAISSEDSLQWTRRDCLPTTGSGIIGLAQSASLLVAISEFGASPVRVSTDGITWRTGVTTPAGTNVAIVFFKNSFYLAAGGGLYQSTNPESVPFTDAGVSGVMGFMPRDLVASAAQIMIVGSIGSTTPVSVTSADTVTWSSNTSLFSARPGLEVPNIAYHDGTRFLVGASGNADMNTGLSCFVDYSYDALTWTGGHRPSSACAFSAPLSYQGSRLFFDGSTYYYSGGNLNGSNLLFTIGQSPTFESRTWSFEVPARIAAFDFVNLR